VARELSSAGRTREAVAELRAALGLWRGPALAGLGGQVIAAAAAGLEEQRLAAWEYCLDHELRLGWHREIAGELQGLAGEHPLRERLAGLLMLALYRSGCQAKALDAYHRLAQQLADELAIDPSDEITRLHEAILRQDRSLDLIPVPVTATDPGPAAGTACSRAPAQLPLNVSGFTGRAAELASLHAMLPRTADPDRDGAAVVISAIGGTAGVGKTALAIRFAHQVADRYTGGQLYINLRGFDPSGPAVAPGDALHRFLIALGVAAEGVPEDLEEQAALYRSVLAGRRVLVLLDNARDAAQVRPLLPGSHGCLVLVTSRNQLTGLVAAEGARPVTIDVLTSEEARSLLASRLGPDRLDAESDVVGELTRVCGGLPLALVIMAARAAVQPRLALADLAAEFQSTRSRLDALRTGDPATDLRTVFSWSLRQLDEPAARMFRLLGIHPGPDITAPAAASLAALPPQEARALLTELAQCNLIIEHAPGRYGFHDLLRAYAADLVNAPDTRDDPRDALVRLFDYYLSTAAVAMDLLHPAEAHRRPDIRSPEFPVPHELADARAALAWLDAERACLLAITARAATQGWPGHAVRLSATLERYLQGGHYPEGLSVHGHARDAARQTGDHDGEASALRASGVLHWMLGSREKAADHLWQALALYRRTANHVGQARCLSNLGAVEVVQGHYTYAVQCQEQALTLFRTADDRPGESIALTNLADTLLRVGRARQAAAHLHRALVLSRQDGDRHGEAHALQTLGEVEQRSGHLERAAKHYRQALDVFSHLGNQRGQAWVSSSLGTICTHFGNPEQAADYHRKAITLSCQGGDREGEAVALNGLGEAAYAANRAADALPHHIAALTLAHGTGNTEQQARAHAGLGRSYDALGRTDRAHQHYQQALDLYDDLGSPDAEKIRARLARAGVLS
jgi:tetratricopeptide (TPR) repeat protein